MIRSVALTCGAENLLHLQIWARSLLSDNSSAGHPADVFVLFVWWNFISLKSAFKLRETNYDSEFRALIILTVRLEESYLSILELLFDFLTFEELLF